MKKNLLIYVIAIITFAITSCTDPIEVALDPQTSIDASASRTSLVLNKDSVGQDVLTVSWPKPQYGFTASPTYILHMDTAGADFSTEKLISVGSSLSKVFKSEELNSLLLNYGIKAGKLKTLNFKIEAQLSSVKSLFSGVIDVNTTPYASYLDLSTTWGVVGSGYNNWGAYPDAPFFTTKTANVIVAYVKLVDGEIKFRQNNDWAVNLGDNGADGTLEAGGANIAVTAGTYKILFNTADNTYTMAKYSWGIVGSAYNNWGATPDFDFTYDDSSDQWRAIVALQTGEFKIRKNNDWGTNYGDDGGDGSLNAGGANIAVTAGKYQITFNENDLTVEIKSIPNIWGLVGSAYNNWGATPDAEFNRDWRNDGVWILKNVTLLDGEYKFRDNNDWGTNYGDDGGDGSLNAGGANITATAGVYTITLDFSDPNNPTYTSHKY